MSRGVTCNFRLYLKIGRTGGEAELKALMFLQATTGFYTQENPMGGIGKMPRLNFRCVHIEIHNLCGMILHEYM